MLLGYHLYALTHDPMNLGWLGLLLAGPSIGLSLFGGDVADRVSRQRITAIGRMVTGLFCLLLVASTAYGGAAAVGGIYVVAFLVSIANAFVNPANQGLETDELPDGQTMRAASLLSSATQAAFLTGPVVTSFLFGWIGPAGTYAVLALMFTLNGALLARFVRPRPPLGGRHEAGVIARIGEGLRFVFADQVLLGSMALDLFAIFFGGVTALLPAIASDVLHVGPTGFGILRAAMPIGSLLAMLIAVRHPPQRLAGPVFHLVIAGFGCAIIGFAFSRDFYLSCALLALAGACDGISVVIRRAILRLCAPGALRGRITAVRIVFVSSSNELGDFESGMLAGMLGTIPAIWLGGVITLAVVSLTAWRAPKLRRLDLVELERAAAS